MGTDAQQAVLQMFLIVNLPFQMQDMDVRCLTIGVTLP